MSKSAALREELKASLWPFLDRAGFIRGKSTSLFTPFRRHTTEMVHVCEIQWDKSYRPSFVINFGELTADRFALVPTREVESGWLLNHCDEQLRLKGRRVLLGSAGSWYQPSKPLWEAITTLRCKYSPAEVTAGVIDNFSEVEDWWRTKAIGPHVVEMRTSLERVTQQPHAASGAR